MFPIIYGILAKLGAVSPVIDWWESGGASGAVAVYQPIGAADLANSYTDLSGNGNDATPGVAPTWDSVGGWQGDGATSFLKTGIIPTTSIFTVLIRYSNAAGNASLLGMYVDEYTQLRIIHSETNDNTFYSYGATGTASPFISGGVVAIAGGKAYRNGVDEGVALSGFDATGSIELYILAKNFIGTANTWTGAKVQAVAIYNNTLSAEQVLAVSDAMAAL